MPELLRRDEPGRPLDRTVLELQALLQGAHPGRQEAKGLDDLRHGLLQLRLAPRDAPASDPGRHGARAGAGQSGLLGDALLPGSGPPGRAGIRSLHLPRQIRGPRRIGAVAVPQVGERAQEIPGVAPLRPQAVESGMERFGRGRMALARTPRRPGPQRRSGPVAEVGRTRRPMLPVRPRTWDWSGSRGPARPALRAAPGYPARAPPRLRGRMRSER